MATHALLVILCQLRAGVLNYAESLCFLKQSLQRTGLFPFGSKGTVSLLPQVAQVIGKDCPEDIPSRFPFIRAFFRDLHAGHLTGAF